MRKVKGGRKLDREMSIIQLLRDGGVDWDDRFRFIYPRGVDEDSNVTDLRKIPNHPEVTKDSTRSLVPVLYQ